ncbi:hypothetical protein C8F01DRAFT_274966 [Mycena amicta]|nr:hypothetical protein C8F01DRAFT_274966 [Mycena amicta]
MYSRGTGPPLVNDAYGDRQTHPGARPPPGRVPDDLGLGRPLHAQRPGSGWILPIQRAASESLQRRQVGYPAVVPEDTPVDSWGAGAGSDSSYGQQQPARLPGSEDDVYYRDGYPYSQAHSSQPASRASSARSSPQPPLRLLPGTQSPVDDLLQHRFSDLHTRFEELQVDHFGLQSAYNELNDQMKDVKDRLSALELSGSPAAAGTTRGLGVGRAQRGRGRGSRSVSRSVSGIPSANLAPIDAALDARPSLLEPQTEAQTKARGLTRRYVSSAFRRVCGVSTRDEWPTYTGVVRLNEETAQPYCTPDFTKGVNDAVNIAVFTEVAATVMLEFQDETALPAGLKDCGAVWDRMVIYEMTKESFNNFKPAYRATHDAEKKALSELNKLNNRHAQRRALKAEHRITAAPFYKQKHGVDPAILVDAELMSDEESGPDPESGESLEGWKGRLSHEGRLGYLNEQARAALTIVEVCKMPWRSEELELIYHELTELYMASLGEKHRMINVRIRSSRVSNRLPTKAPFNFGINMDWLNEHRSDARYDTAIATAQWGEWEDPVGFGSKKDVLLESEELNELNN